MKYSVLWLPAAEQDLAACWLDPATRTMVAEAASQIDRLLQYAPQNQGESRADNLRVFFVAPLAVLFRVKEDDRLVEVVHVWQFA